MATFVILRSTGQSPQRIEADSARYDQGECMWVFRDTAGKPVAWVPRERADVVAESDVVGKP